MDLDDYLGKIPFMTSTQKMVAWSDFQKMFHHLFYSPVLLNVCFLASVIPHSTIVIVVMPHLHDVYIVFTVKYIFIKESDAV